MDGKRVALAPAFRLKGARLAGGWVVGDPLSKRDGDTGGRFSVGYVVSRGGTKAFLKAIDLRQSLLTDSGVEITRVLLGGQLAEAAVLDRCARAGLSRVISPLGSGVWADPTDAGATPVPYVITEWADGGDLRRIITSNVVELPFAFGMLHDLAVGVRQIHGLGIAHHDLKPSNALLVGKRLKLGDFGHAVDDLEDIAEARPCGTLAYAAPEILYGGTCSTWDAYRAVDLYLLGSLVGGVFLGGLPVTTAWIALLDDAIHPARFTGTFEDAKPFVVDAFVETLKFLENRLPPDSPKLRIVRLVRYLSWPDPGNRGHPAERHGHHDRYDLRRIVSELNLLAHQARRRSA